MRCSTLVLYLVTLLAAAPAFAAPGDAIGSAVTVVNIVTASLDQQERKLAEGDGVRAQELISVDADGRSEIELRDKTKLALGPGAKLLLDRFVYDPDISGGAIVLNLVRGSFRFITGIAAKPAYVIHLPTASITVRGTIFDVYVKPDGTAWLLLIEGMIEVCSSAGKCRVHDEPGKLIHILPDTVGAPIKWAGLPSREDAVFDVAFPFVSRAPSFDPDPIFTRDQIVLGRFPERPHPNDDEPAYEEEKSEPKKKSNKADDNDEPRVKKKHVERSRYVERRRRPRHEESGQSPIPNSILLGIGGGIRFGGHRHGGDHGGYHGK